MSTHTQVNASPITKITSWLKFLGKNLHLVGCATLCAKSKVMLTLIKHVTKFYFGSNLNHLRMIQTLFAKPSLRPSKLPKTASLPNIHQYRDAARIFANGTQDLQVQSSLGFSEPEHQAKSYVPSTIITRCR